MTFAAPMFLLGLVPWAAVAVWLLLGQRQTSAVPFLDLWQATPDAPPRARRHVHLPPLAILAALAAMLLAICAAARPVWRSTRAGRMVTVVLDRGVTMSSDARRA